MHESTDESGFADNRRTLIGHWMDRQPIRARYILQPDSKEENTVPGFSDRFPEVKQVHFDGVTLIRDPDVFFFRPLCRFRISPPTHKKGTLPWRRPSGQWKSMSVRFSFVFFLFFLHESRESFLAFGFWLFFFGCGTWFFFFFGGPVSLRDTPPPPKKNERNLWVPELGNFFIFCCCSFF